MLSVNAAFYDSNKVFLSRYGESSTGEYAFTTPDQAAYVRIYCGKGCSDVWLMHGTHDANATVQIHTAQHSFVAYSASPYLKMDGMAVTNQPAKAIVSMLVYKGRLYCLLENNAVVVYNESTGTIVSGVQINEFMKAQMAKWAGKGICYGELTAEGTKLLKIWKGMNLRTYEFVPLGVFIAERPNVPYVNEMHFTCYDRMQDFEDDMPSDNDLGLIYPLYFSDLYIALCNHVGVPYESDGGTVSFINSNAQLSARPEAFDNATMRDVLKWIAEAACAVARINRDGYMKLDWIRDTNVEIDETGYSEFSPYWYETARIGKLYNQASNGDYEYTTGFGDEAYVIQDNPLLKGVTM